MSNEEALAALEAVSDALRGEDCGDVDRITELLNLRERLLAALVLSKSGADLRTHSALRRILDEGEHLRRALQAIRSGMCSRLRHLSIALPARSGGDRIDYTG